ncbi:hypothetical protein ACQKWADRAFT_322822 [Trichoderma austrokoningii]
MSEEASQHSSIPLLDSIELSTSIRPSTSDNALSWRENITNEHPGDIDIEKFPQGYSRYSALLASDNSFQIWRRFSILRTRLLLIKQDKLSQLEARLENIDAEDEKFFPAFLGSNREDGNEERKEVLEQIDSSLKDYVFNLEPALKRAISNLRNWHRNNKTLTAKETSYLDREDLFSNLGNSSWSDRLIGVMSQYFGTRKQLDIPNDHYCCHYGCFYCRLVSYRPNEDEIL